MNALLNDPNQTLVSVSLLTLLPHLPIKHFVSHGEGLEDIVYVSTHVRKGQQLLKFHTSNHTTVFDFVPNNKKQLNGMMTIIPKEEADRVGIEYRQNPQYPERTLDASVECNDKSIATEKPIGIKPAPLPKQPKRTEKYIQPFPVGSSLYQITRGKNKGKWTVWGLEGVQNSLKRFANIPFYVVKWEHTAAKITNSGPITVTHFSLHPFNTKEAAEEWASDINKNEIEISEWLLTQDQIVK